jgi:ASC-1-like (ASCH) protein
VQTEVWESDPFTPQKGRLIATLATEYRFQKGDEIYFDGAPGRLKVRVMDVRIHVKGDGAVQREILALKL